MSNPVRILMAEDHPLFRDGLRQLLLTDPTLHIIAETSTGPEAWRLARELKPDVAILDVDIPGMSGIEIARARVREGLSFEIVFLTMHREEDLFQEAVSLGAKGYVLKDSAASEILESIRAVAAGRHYVSPSMTGFLMQRAASSAHFQRERSGLDTLTPAERRILKLIASDRTSKEIAQELGLSPRTIENHRTNMSAKLKLQGSHSLLKFAFENRSRL